MTRFISVFCRFPLLPLFILLLVLFIVVGRMENSLIGWLLEQSVLLPPTEKDMFFVNKKTKIMSFKGQKSPNSPLKGGNFNNRTSSGNQNELRKQSSSNI